MVEGSNKDAKEWKVGATNNVGVYTHSGSYWNKTALFEGAEKRINSENFKNAFEKF